VGEIGALLRREGIYSSLLATWRKKRAASNKPHSNRKSAGARPTRRWPRRGELEQLTRENDRLRRQLAQAHTIIDVQKKVCMLLGQLTDDTPDGRS
jgi:transposase